MGNFDEPPWDDPNRLVAAAVQPWPAVIGPGFPALDEKFAAAMRTLSDKREEYVRAWIAETGLHPSECELVVTVGLPADMSTVYRMRVRRRRS